MTADEPAAALEGRFERITDVPAASEADWEQLIGDAFAFVERQA